MVIVLSSQQKENLKTTARLRRYSDIAHQFQLIEPRIFAALSKEEQLFFIEYCHRTAQQYGFESLMGLYTFVDLATVLGSSFWRDPLYRDFTRELERRPVYGDGMAIDRIRALLSERLLLLRGEDGSLLAASLTAYNDIYRHPESFTWVETTPEAHAMALLKHVCPIIVRTYDEIFIAEMNSSAIERAAGKYDLRSNWSLGTFCLISMLMGSGFDTDPQYPWIARELARSHEIGPERAMMNMSTQLVHWFDAALEEIRRNDIH